MFDEFKREANDQMTTVRETLSRMDIHGEEATDFMHKFRENERKQAEDQARLDMLIGEKKDDLPSSWMDLLPTDAPPRLKDRSPERKKSNYSFN